MYKIIVVDDDKDILEVLEVILKRDAINMIGLTDTKKLDAHLEDKPCMILLDVHIMGEDGYEVCRKLKTDPKTKDIPVIMFSAASSESVKVKCPADDFVEKPFDIRHLVSVIKKHCEPSIFSEAPALHYN